jgi:hypothetical protein
MHKDQARTQPQHPDPLPDKFNPDMPANGYQGDLNPHMYAGENRGVQSPHPEKSARSAYDIKELHGQLSDLTEAELRDIEIMPEGARLEQGAKYIDLRHMDRGEFVALATMTAGPDNLYVPKSETDYQLWNRLTGVTDPARLDNQL